MLRRHVLAMAMAAMAILPVSSALSAESTDPVVLTVTGNIAAPNRGPLDAFEDAVFSHLDVTFDKAFTFTLPELRALPQASARAQYNEWPREVTASGPTLADVLKAAGATGAKVTVQAADGYTFDFTAQDVAKGQLILAIEADGKPLAMGARGPLWVFGTPNSFEGQDQDEGFVFEVIRIDVTDPT